MFSFLFEGKYNYFAFTAKDHTQKGLSDNLVWHVEFSVISKIVIIVSFASDQGFIILILFLTY